MLFNSKLRKIQYSMGIFKTREEHEREERLKHAKRLRDEDERRRTRIDNRDYKCKLCGSKFQDIAFFYAHLDKHNEEMRKALVCNQFKCGKKFSTEKEFLQHIMEHKNESKRKIKNSLR